MIKITGIYDNKNLAKALRINFPLEEIGKSEEFDVKLVESDSITDEIARDSDVIYMNWGIANPTYELSVLKAKYPNLCYILDVDDSNDYSIAHPIYRDINRRISSQGSQATLAFECDTITVSTSPIKESFKGLNSNITVVENFLPQTGQWVANKPKRDKVHIGIYGTINSHYADYLQLKPIINRLAKNRRIAEECEFFICGYRPSPYWDEIVKFFEVKKNIKLHIVEAKPVTEYMQLLENLDICIIPLEEIPYNEAKSGLKLLECSLADVVAIGSKLYQDKEISSILICDTPLSYEQTIVYLLDKNNYNTVLNKQKEANLGANDWNGRIEKLKNVFREVKRVEPEIDGLVIYGVTYEDTQKSEYWQYNNSNIRTVEQKSYLFEYNALLDVLPYTNETCEYFGLLSWRFPEKTGISKKALFSLLKAHKYQEYDVINLTPTYNDLSPEKKGFYKWTEFIHPTWLDKFTKLCGKLDLSVEEPDQSRIIFSNMVVAKKNVYQDFVHNVIIPAINILETDMKEEAFENAKYRSSLSEEKLEKLTGLNYWTFHTFLLERLWSAWLMTNKEIKVLKLL